MITFILFTSGILLIALFSAFEISYVMSGKWLVSLRFQGKKRAFLSNPNRVIITILIGINLAQVFVAVSLTIYFLGHLKSSNAVFLAGTLSTVAILFFGEILPKTFARRNPEKVVLKLTHVFYYFYLALSIFVLIFESIFRKKTFTHRKKLTEELADLLWETHYETKSLEPEEYQFLKNTLNFFNLKAKQMMKPLKEVFVVPLNMKPEELRKTEEVFKVQRFLVYREKLDQIAGMVHIKDLFGQNVKKLSEILRPVAFVFEDWTMDKVIEAMNRKNTAYAVVVDEYGNATGVIDIKEVLGRIFS